MRLTGVGLIAMVLVAACGAKAEPLVATEDGRARAAEAAEGCLSAAHDRFERRECEIAYTLAIRRLEIEREHPANATASEGPSTGQVIAGYVAAGLRGFLAGSGATSGAAEEDPPGQQGCCSYHGGVCGCSGGRVMCCDHSQSPSCRC